MKKLFIVAALAAASFTGFAQDKETKKLGFSVGVEAGFPMGNIVSGLKVSDVYGVGIGGFAQGNYMVADNLGLTLHAGYSSFSGKDGGKALSVIPVLAGIKYMFNENFYGAAQLGMSFMSSDGESQSAFTYAPGVGYKVSNFDFSLNYTGRSYKVNDISANISSLGLRAAYNF